MRKIVLAFLLLIFTACNFLAPIHPGAPQVAPPAFSVIAHPDGPLYIGDKVSFEVLSATKPNASGNAVRISQGEKILGEEKIQPFGLGERFQATFYWVWDTQGLDAGSYTLTFSLLPGGSQWDEKFTLLPVSDVPSPEPNARWEFVDTNCCEIHYISGTDAEKDLGMLKTMVDAQAVDVASRFGAEINGKIPVTFMPRVLGHSGFTSDGIYVSYLHQNYTGNATQQVIHHEMVHWVDGQQKSDFRPTILLEGLAVYLSDGHFKKEPILPRAAAVLEFGWYIPLDKLSNSFYLSQHEISYIEAAALISYLVTTYGRDEFNNFYRDIHSVPNGSQAEALDAAIQKHFNMSLAQLEKDFTAFLRQQKVDDATRSDLRLTVAFYDTVRRYQRQLDPSAYFLYAWLPNISEMRQRGIVADLLRSPKSAINQQIETMLVSADASLRSGNYTATESEIRAVNVLLDFLQYWKK